jgi:hypothetical protein
MFIRILRYDLPEEVCEKTTLTIIVNYSRRGLGISRTALGPTQPPIQWVPGTLSLGVKLPGREADHSFPSSAEVKMCGVIPTLPQYAFMTWCLVKTQGQLNIYLHSLKHAMVL